MKFYAQTFPIAGSVIVVFFPFVTRYPMPWWPDTAVMAVTFGTFAVIVAVKARTERETNRRLWNGVKALARRIGSN